MQALIKAPDCFTMVTALLDPRELQYMRCVSKGMYRGITKEVMLQCVKSTMARFTGPHAMPDGAVRFYSTFGHSSYDICKVQSVYQLKQEGFNVQNHDMEFARKIKLDTLLSHSLRLIGVDADVIGVREVSRLYFEVSIKDAKPQIAITCFRFEPPDGSLAERYERYVKKGAHFHDFDFHRRRLIDQKPTLLQKLFEANDKIRALESETSALKIRLANAERSIADAK